MKNMLATLLALMMAVTVMGQANDFERIQANMASRMMGSLQVPTESTTLNASEPSTEGNFSSMPITSTMPNPRVVSPIKQVIRPIRTRRSPQNSYGDNSDQGSGQSNSIYLPGSGPSMPDASSTAAPQFGLGVTYSNRGTAKPTTSTANPAAAWYSNWLNSLPDSLKSLYGVTTTSSPQGLVGRRRRSISRLARRRRSADDEMVTSTRAPCRKHASTTPQLMEQDTLSSTESAESPNNILRSKRSMSEIRDRVQGVFNGSAFGINDSSSSEDSVSDTSSDESSISDILLHGDEMVPSASSDSTGTPIQADDLAGLNDLISQSAGNNSTDGIQIVYLNTSTPASGEMAEMSSESSQDESSSTESVIDMNSTSMP